MRVLHALGWFYPESSGGTEAYVATLAERLRELGVQAAIAAPRDGDRAAHERWRELDVFRYPVGAGRSDAQLAGHAPHEGFEAFQAWLDEQPAGTVWHQHSLTYGCGLHHLRAAKQRGLATVLTVHVPQPVCIRGTLLYEGRTPCDGRIDERRCASCWLEQRGMPEPGRSVLARVPPSWGAHLRGRGRAGTAAAATNLVRAHRHQLHEAARHADRVVAVCDWLFDALQANGVPRDKLVLQRQGVASASPAPPRPRAGPLRVGFLGRAHPVKGLEMLVRAVHALPPGVPLQLQAHVAAGDEETRAHRAQVERLAAGDARIRIDGALEPHEVPAFLRSVDVLAVPSQWMETGPLVVLEAFANGTPVLGSDLGGIAELVRHGRDGLLVAHADGAAWTAALARLASDRALVDSLAAGVVAPRSLRDLAEDALASYRAVLGPVAA